VVGVGEPTLDYFARERLVEDMKGLRGALGQLTDAFAAIGSKVKSPVPDTVSDAASLAEALIRLPKPAPQIDLELYTALQDAEAVACLEAFQVKQAAWLDAVRRLAESAMILMQ
jgi:hypothetical protein